MVSVYVRRHGPIAIMWVLFLALTANYFTGELPAFKGTVLGWASIVAIFMGITATVSFLLRSTASLMESAKKRKVGEGLILDAYTLILFAAIVTISLALTMESDAFAWIESWLYIPAEAVAYGFGVIYISAAVYRTWRIRSVETALLVISFILVMIRGTPVFGSVAGSQDPGIWVATYLAKGPFRVLNIGAGIGILVTLVRALRGRQAGFE